MSHRSCPCLLAVVLLGCGCAGDLTDLDSRAGVDATADAIADGPAAPDRGPPDTSQPQELGIYDGGQTTPCHTATCQTSKEICVRTYTGSTFSYKCKDVPQKCLANRTCACLGQDVCTQPYTSCADGPTGANLVACSQ